MIKKRWFGAGANLCALMTLCLAGTLSHGAVTAAPPTVTFTSPTQSATITLTSNGAVIPARDIRGWKFIASGHDYRRMLSVEKKEGALKIAPSKTLEVGSYDLNIETAAGPVTVLVLATLSDMPDVVEKTAALTGQSEQKTKENMGMSTTIASEAVQPTPPNAKLTPTLETATDTTVNTETTYAPPPGYQKHVWRVDGLQVSTEPSLKTTFRAPGIHAVECLASNPAPGTPNGFVRLRYNTTVKPK